MHTTTVSVFFAVRLWRKENKRDWQMFCNPVEKCGLLANESKKTVWRADAHLTG